MLKIFFSNAKKEKKIDLPKLLITICVQRQKASIGLILSQNFKKQEDWGKGIKTFQACGRDRRQALLPEYAVLGAPRKLVSTRFMIIMPHTQISMTIFLICS